MHVVLFYWVECTLTWGANALMTLHNEGLGQRTAKHIVVHKTMLMLYREEPSPGEVVYPRGSISGLPEAHATRKERFVELDDLQPGWEVELRGRKGGTTVDATFFSPTGNDIHVKPADGTYVSSIRRRHTLDASCLICRITSRHV